MADDLVLTPGGYKRRENVHHVPPGHEVRMNGDIFEIHHQKQGLVRSVGRIKRHTSKDPLMPRSVARRSSPERPFTNNGPGIPGVDGEMDGWLSFAGWTNTTGSPISSFATTWTVPDAPQNVGSQTIFLFNGIQNSTMIYQPVLQWGSSAAGGDQKWSVACWYADSPNGHSFYSLLVDVASGTQLTGTMSLTDQNATRFSYAAQFAGLNDTALPIYNVDELTWANETLEAYNIKTRADLPASAKTAFSSINIMTGNAVPRVAWARQNYYPALGTDASIAIDSGNGGEVDIVY